MGASFNYNNDGDPVFAYWDEAEPYKGYNKPWDISIVDGKASFKGCCFKRPPFFVYIGDINDHVLAKGDDDLTWVSAKINTDDNTVEIVSGNEGEVTGDGKNGDYGDFPTDQFVYLPLYILRYKDDNGSTAFFVSLDIRSLDAGVYA